MNIDLKQLAAIIMSRYFLLMIFCTNAFAHGSSHPHWNFHRDDLGRPYITCGNDAYSEYGTLFETHKYLFGGEFQEQFSPTIQITNERWIQLFAKLDQRCD